MIDGRVCIVYRLMMLFVCVNVVFCNRCVILLPALVSRRPAPRLAVHTWTSNWVVYSCKYTSLYHSAILCATHGDTVTVEC